MKKLFQKLNSTHQGFVILFTILISSIILMIGFGIFSIATRETILSSTSREAQFAFYAADAGVECALYYQTHFPQVFTAASNGFSGSAPGSIPNCGSSPLDGSGGNGTIQNPYQFDVMVDSTTKTCTHVTVYDQDSSTRRIISEGYNICSFDSNGVPRPVKSNPILVERVLDTTFSIGSSSASATVTSTSTGTPSGN